SPEQARAYYDASGIRWSELLRLPYFDPSRMIIVDSMHNLFLGLLKEHFRSILGFRSKEDKRKDEKRQKGSASSYEPVFKVVIPNNPANTCPEDEVENVKKLIDILEQPMQTFDAGHAITQEEMEVLWQDIEQMLMPSWLSSVPARFGGANGDGKLKADQWRTIAMTYMPVTLIQMWSDSGASSKRRELLEFTMDLVQAVILAASHQTSQDLAGRYLSYMLSYRTHMKILFPNYSAHPNHHMALHLSEYLLMFGPVHGWWTFPFEQQIGMLERISTNYQ
ncbi:hypothetical protein EDD85DRAFT_731715, partial [Armillaria nabsnona]